MSHTNVERGKQMRRIAGTEVEHALSILCGSNRGGREAIGLEESFVGECWGFTSIELFVWNIATLNPDF